MEKTSEMSDNLYYADQLGTIEDQIAFLDSFSDILNPELIFFPETTSQCLLFTAVKVIDNKITCFEVKLLAGKEYRMFCDGQVLDIVRYLYDRGYQLHFVSSSYKKLICEEEVTEAVADTAAAEDAASACLTEALECGK